MPLKLQTSLIVHLVLLIKVVLSVARVGYFMLTEPHGLNYITHCEEEGFHVHPKEPPLYEVSRTY